MNQPAVCRALEHLRKTIAGSAVVAAALLIVLFSRTAWALGGTEAPEPAGSETDRQLEHESRDDRDVAADKDFDSEREREDSGRAQAHERGEGEREVEPDEVLSIDLSREGWTKARAMGFRVVEDDVLPQLGFRLTELSTPGGIPAAAALRRLRTADPHGTYDVNPRYGTAGERACEGIRCDGQKLVAWPTTGCPQAVRVGMLDTAVSESSPALAGERIKQRHFGESRASVQGAEHGTAVATILAGQLDAGFAGLLPRATLFAADVFNYGAGEHKSTNAMMIARGLDWLLAQHPAAINVSIAGTENAVLHEAIRRVTAQGVPVIAAAGNLGPDGPPRYPAAYAEVIAVTAVDLLGQTYEHANRGPYIDVAAPGVHIWSAGASGHGKFFDGTSFATPFVTAEVALLRLAEPQRSLPELKAAFHSATGSTDSVHAGAPSASVLKSRGCDR